MSEKIKHVAKNMREAYGEHCGEDICSWHDADDSPKAAWMACARAAIEAMRSPAGDVLRIVADNTGPVGCCSHTAETVAEVWQATIDSILNEGTET